MILIRYLKSEKYRSLHKNLRELFTDIFNHTDLFDTFTYSRYIIITINVIIKSFYLIGKTYSKIFVNRFKDILKDSKIYQLVMALQFVIHQLAKYFKIISNLIKDVSTRIRDAFEGVSEWLNQRFELQISLIPVKGIYNYYIHIFNSIRHVSNSIYV